MKSDLINGARLGFERVGRGCIMALLGHEARYSTANELAGRVNAIPEAKMLLTAVSEAVEKYNPASGAVIILETESGMHVLILGPGESRRVGGIEFVERKAPGG